MKKITKIDYVFIGFVFLLFILCAVAIFKTFGISTDELISGYLGIVGAIIGGLVAVYVAFIQINQIRQQDIENSRNYLSVYSTGNDLHDLFNGKIDHLRRETGKLLVTDDYEYLTEDINTIYPKLKHMSDYRIGQKEYDIGKKVNTVRCYSITVFGNSDAIIDCTIEILISDDEKLTNTDTLKIWIDNIEKNQELIIPLCSQKLKMLRPYVDSIDITYRTLKNEKIHYSQSERKQEIIYKQFKGKKKTDNSLIMDIDDTATKFQYLSKKEKIKFNKTGKKD
ncbi:DUF4190 domain-containing protein [Sporolactobacillus terrae]|uniref:DUF4190 domain-containing protein n=1 Tax=Sporolactobacillus terrae TaxID=269673 RepID=UPI00048F4221|nr:DUF4190 domain-containing protein [Sporolactobacillus terrae]